MVPGPVAGKLAYLAVHGGPGERIFSQSRQWVGDMVGAAGQRVGIELTPHRLRKWCGSFWARRGQEAMVSFVLRHHLGNLRGRYVAPLAPVEVMALQDRFMTPDPSSTVFGG